MIFSRTAEYGIRAMLHLARSPQGRAVHCQNIAAVEGIPPEFLKLILRRLATKGLVRSTTGTKGGFMLGREPREIRPVDIIIALDEDPCDVQCALGYARCSESHPCPMHVSWQGLRRRMRAFLRQQTLAQLARAGGARKKNA
jgi:Rrf2 family protein